MSRIEHLLLEFPQFQLRIRELDLPEEGVLVLSGPSGTGKSSFLKCLMGFQDSSDRNFRWIFQRKEMARLSPSQRRLGVVFQSGNLFPHMTALENIWFAAKARKLDLTELEPLAEELVRILDVKRILSTKAASLSGGEQQRIALARALLSDAQLLLLDEPFSSLDTAMADRCRELLQNALRVKPVPVWMVSHNPQDAKILASSVLHFELGKDPHF